MKKVGKFFARDGIFIFLAAFVLNGCALKFGQPSPDCSEKARYLAHLGQFAEWPDYAFGNSKSALVIGLYGGNPFGDELEKAVKNENVNGRPIVIRRMTPFSNLKNCQILFIARSQKSNLPLIFHALNGTHVLTVSDADNFLASGGMIQFFKDAGKVRFEIARGAVEKAGLKLNSQLLKMAAQPQVIR